MPLPESQSDPTRRGHPILRRPPFREGRRRSQTCALIAGPWAARAPVLWLALLGLVLLAGYAAAPERHDPLPGTLAAEANIPGIPGARYWGDERPAGLDA